MHTNNSTCGTLPPTPPGADKFFDLQVNVTTLRMALSSDGPLNENDRAALFVLAHRCENLLSEYGEEVELLKIQIKPEPVPQASK